jgi:hypothetical protein
MLTKLTLTIDQSVVAKAKEFAQEKNKSVSRIVEEYLRNIATGKTEGLVVHNLGSPITDSLVGMFKDTGEDYDAMIEKARLDKYI